MAEAGGRSEGGGLLEPAFLRRLERLALTARRTLKGAGLGERRAKRHGGSVEFADYRPYAPGDDTRRIDWYAYARLEDLVLKLYVEEQDLTLHVLVDRSASMETGTPNKARHAARLALALAWIALAGGDQVRLRGFVGGEASPPVPAARGRAAWVRLARALEAPGAGGETSLGAACRRFVASRPTAGVVVLISDLLDPAGYQRPLEQLRYAGHELHVLHVLSPQELRPEVDQDLDLVDAETGEVATVAMDRAAIAAYERALDDFCEGVSRHCKRHQIGYAAAPSDASLEELILGTLRRRALVR